MQEYAPQDILYSKISYPVYKRLSLHILMVDTWLVDIAPAA